METQLCNELVLLLCQPRVHVADIGSEIEEFPEWEIRKSRDEWRLLGVHSSLVPVL